MRTRQTKSGFCKVFRSSAWTRSARRRTAPRRFLRHSCRSALALCLALLAFLTLLNLRGIRETGLALALPTYAFVGLLAIVIVVGLARLAAAGGHPIPVVAPPSVPAATAAASLWLWLRAFASGCTAMTGVEAVSNAVPIFQPPSARTARPPLTAIVAILVFLLGG